MNDMPGYIPPNSQGFDFDPFDFTVTQPLRKVAATVDDNPDDAARAVDLSKSTGVAAPVIAADIDSFEQAHKASLANQIMRTNPALIDYVRNHSMAASVSNDDWANLADVAKASSRLHSLLAMDPAQGAIGSGLEAAKQAFMQKSAVQQSIDSYYADNPFMWSLWSGFWFIPDGVVRGYNALMAGQFGALRGGAESAYKLVTGDTSATGAENFGQEAVQNAAIILAGSLAEPYEPAAMPAIILRQREGLQAAKPWTDAGLMPPRGVHPAIDEALASTNEEAITRLEDIIRASNKTSTRGRSYEMFHNFVEDQHGNTTVGIHGPAVAAIYGDKVPELGDGLLGFVPHIGDQLLAANLSGIDIHVPITDWLANDTTAIMPLLRDDIRMFKGGITKREAQDPFEPKPTIDAPIAQVRAVSGMEPRFALGDRKLTLKPDLTFKDFELFKQRFPSVMAEGDPEAAFSSSELKTQDRYWFTDSNDNVVGEIHLVPDLVKKELYIDHINTEEGPNSLGPASVRDVLRQLKDIYPGYTLTGDRVSGAREVSGGGLKEPKVRLNLDKLDSFAPSSLRETDDLWRQLSSNVSVRVVDAVDSIINTELRRVVGPGPELVAATDIRTQPGAGGLAGGLRPQGVFVPGRPPIVAWNALNPDAIGVVSHEAIHYLRGFFTPEEWAELGWAAIQRDWLGKYNIREKYPTLDVDGQIEEAVAEGYRGWAKGQEHIEEPTGLVAEVFQKMKDLWEAIKDKLRRYFGQDIDVEHLLRNVHEGYIARRGPQDKPRISGKEEFSTDEKPLPLSITGALTQPMSSEPLPDYILRDIHRQGDYFSKNRDLYDHAVENDIVRNFDQFINASGHQLEAIVKLAKEKNLPLPGPPPIKRPLEPKYSISDEDFQNIKANSLGLDLKSWRNLQESLKARHESDLVAAVDRAEKAQRQTQTAEWRKHLPKVRAEVERTILQRPDVMADMFVNSGEYEGQKLRQRIPLRADDLTDEQKASLPDNYYAKNGLPADDVARLFGYQDRQHLVERLSIMAAQRGDRTPQAHLKSLIDGETQLRMEREHGNLESNIMEAALDQALSDTDINLLIDEYHAAGMMSKQATIDKNVIKAQALDAFSKLPIGGISSQRFITEMARHDRDAERALIPGQVDEVAALKSMESKIYTGIMAAEARKLEKDIGQFNITAKKLSKREVSNLPQPYINFIHQILDQVGKLSGASAMDYRSEIAEHGAAHTFKEFVTDLQNAGQETDIWSQLFNEAWGKSFKDLTAEEFLKVKDTVDNLNYIGKNTNKITDGTTKAEFADKMDGLIYSLQSFGIKHYDLENVRWIGPTLAKVAALPKTALAMSLTIETVFGRFDHFDPFGVWTQYGIRPLIEAAYEENVMKRQVAEKLKDIYDGETTDAKLKELVYNPIWRHPLSGDLISMDRSKLRAVMLNTGSRGSRISNLTYLSKGHSILEDAILSWIDSNARKEDWDWCQKIWDLFRDELWEPAQRMRRNLSGVGARSLEVPPIQTKFGEYRGGYYPVIRQNIKQSQKSLEEGLFGPNHIRATTWDGYAQERTGKYSALELSLDPMTNRISQIIHDIALRPAILNAAKIFLNDDIKTAISRYYGKEYSALLEPYLKDIAGASKYRSEGQETLARFVDGVQRNMVVNLIGVNIGTFLKHTPTAFGTSLAEVGPARFAKAVHDLFSVDEATGEKNFRFIYDRLEELQNRNRSWLETLTGTAGEVIPGHRFDQLQHKIAELAVKPIAFGDMLSSVPTGMAAWTKAKEEGYSDGDAAFLANRSIRRAHGSSLMTNRSEAQRRLPAMITTFYTYFNDILNRQAEVVWRAADTLDAVGDHNWAEAKSNLPKISAGIFSTVLLPAIVEQLVSPIQFGPNTSWEKKAAQILSRPILSSWLFIREFANFLIEGRDPALGLYTTAYHEIGDIFKDFTKSRRGPMSKEEAGRVIRDSASFLGLILGGPGGAIGHASQFAFGTHVGTEHPQGPWGWGTGLRYGTLRGHSPTFERRLQEGFTGR